MLLLLSNLCLEEKLLLTKGKHNLLNRRTELFSRCCHVTKHLINFCQLPDDSVPHETLSSDSILL